MGRLLLQRPRLEGLEPRLLLHDNPTMDREHAAVFALVPDLAVTHFAIQDGDWSNPMTWVNGAVPAAEANVLVPAGLTVTVDGKFADALRTARVDGTLRFATDVDTTLTVDTLIVSTSGTLQIGAAAQPVSPGVVARVVFADRGPIDTTWDPNLFSRGLISHGTTTVFGSARTGHAALAAPAARGATRLVLAQAPTGWRAGDELVLAGVSTSRNEDEKLKVVSVKGAAVTVDKPLAYAHASSRPEYGVYVANLTRNVVFESQNRTPGETTRRGHVMLMHSPHVDVNNAAFVSLGRTDKKVRINDAQLDAAGALVPGTGTNVRGRYALHLHRTGTDPGHEPAAVRGCAAVDGVGWGFVNHSSNADIEDSVTFDVVGAGFVTEAGDEIGSFRRNFALRSAGSGTGIESRQDVQDFGHEGNGFWFQGPGVEVTDNVAAGQRRGAFVYFTRGLQQGALGTTRFSSANLPDPSIANGQPTMAVGDVPVRLFRNNYAFASGDGFESWFHLLNATHSARSVVEGLRVWKGRSGRAVFTPYTRHMTLLNLRALGNPADPSGTGIARNDVTRSMVYENAVVEGFDIGISAPKRGTNVIRGGALTNVKNIDIAAPLEEGRVIDVKGVRFGLPSPAALGNDQPFDVYLRPDLDPYEQDLPDVFASDRVFLNGSQVFSEAQAADFVPYPQGEGYSPPAYVPPELVNKTNAQLKADFGLAVGGAVAPALTVRRARVNGLLGPPAVYPPAITLNSAKYTNMLSTYKLSYTPAGSTRVRETQVTPLREGWNLLTRTVGGALRTMLIYGDTTAPEFRPAASMQLRINPLALSRGFEVRGTIVDASVGETGFTRRFTDLLTRPVVTRDDGTQYIALDFQVKDRAGNATDVVLELSLDPAAPL